MTQRRAGRRWAALAVQRRCALLVASAACVLACAWALPAAGSLPEPPGGGSRTAAAAEPSVLFVIAHPDDETMFGLGRFRERGWRVSIALVTNGEGGQVVQGIVPAAEREPGGDRLVEKSPGAGTWLTLPPCGPRLFRIPTVLALARERRAEFLRSQADNRVAAVYFLSGLRTVGFEDSWDRGVTRWDVPLLTRRLAEVVRRVRPDLVVTLDPDETWVHPQHVGLGVFVRALYARGGFDTPGRAQPPLYALRETGWYARSQAALPGDEAFRRDAWSPVLHRTYARDWAHATSAYVSQSSHPLWFAARVEAGLLPGYGASDVLRRLDGGAGPSLSQLFAQDPPCRAAMRRLPRTPRIVDLSRR